MSTPSTIKQKSTVVDDGERRIEVRRMRWKPAVAFIKLLAGHINELRSIIVAPASKSPEDIAAARESTLNKILPALIELILKVEILLQHLVENSTDLKQAEFDDLDLATALQVIRDALQLNAGADLKKLLAEIVAVLGALSATTTNATEKSTPTL